VRSTRGNQQDCVGFGTKPSCRCTTLFASKRGHPLCFIAVAVAKCELSEPRAEHGAAQIAGKAINLAGKNREDDCADADEIRAEALSVEEEDLANDLAAEEETRQNAYAAGDAGWLSDEAAASIASTTIAAAATSTFLTDLVAADVGYVTAAAPLLTSATQAFNNAVDAAYVGAFPGDADQAAVSGAWTAYYNAMATAAQNAMTAEASAYQGYIGSMAGDIQATMNDVASESTQLATDYGNALTGYVSTVAAAATLQTSQTAAAGVVWVDTVATDVKNAVQNAASAWLQMADDGVDAAKALVDDYSNYWNSFAHSYLGAAAAHGTNVINEDRLAAKDIDSQLTVLASGIAAEQHDLNLDGLTEWKTAALALSPLDDALVNAWAALESAWSILTAWFTHADTAASAVSDFAGATVDYAVGTFNFTVSTVEGLYVSAVSAIGTISSGIDMFTTQLGYYGNAAIQQSTDILNLHYNRNQFNHPPATVAAAAAAAAGWTLLSAGQARYHQHNLPSGVANLKYISPDGHMEAVYGPDQLLVTDVANIGTYNYSDNYTDGIDDSYDLAHHMASDVIPYYALGNSPSDTTPLLDRVMGAGALEAFSSFASGLIDSYFETHASHYETFGEPLIPMGPGKM
jgi:hypothetical protein